jgi:hypothetical protein
MEASELNGTSVVVPMKSVRVLHVENIERTTWFSESANAIQIDCDGEFQVHGLSKVTVLSMQVFWDVRVFLHAVNRPVFAPDDR